jgi:predicted metalloendopeptidase
MTHRYLPWLSLLALCAVPATQGAADRSEPGSVLSGMDLSVVPGDDFFAYANGGWLKSTEIPPDRSLYGTGSIVAELTLERTRGLLEDAAVHGPAGTESRRIGDYYATFMDEAAIEAKGLQPLHARLARIASISDRHQLARELGATLRADVDALNNTRFHTDNLLGLWVAQDLDDPTRYSPFLLQGGLGMPDRDFYVNPSPHMAAVRDKYRAHIAAVLRLAKIPDADARADRIYELEHRIAEVHWTRADSEQVRKANNHWRRADFDARAPGLDWASYLGAAGLQNQSAFVVWQPSALTGIAALVGSEPLATWKDYLEFHAIDRLASYLPKAFVDEQFAFYEGILNGTPELRPRWKRAVDATNDALGEAVGKLYVQHYFPPSEKARAEEMVRNLLAAFSTRIDHLQWMAPATKVKAKAKLATLKVSVGYPDKWRDYSGLQVAQGDALGNAVRAELFEYHRNLAKLGAPVDRGEWVMTPQTVNAVNLPVMNAINFPAAILQPPYFDPKRSIVMDYGAIGATIGHEISHSFDDQGALFDASGRLQNWWMPQDFAHFEASAAQLAAQFDDYQPFPDVHVNGKQTLSENVADVAGLAAAYDAYRTAVGPPARADAAIRAAFAAPSSAPGAGAHAFSSDQLFFLSFAQSWRQKIREPALRQRIVTDGHAPAQFRADTVRNLDPWYAAFDVKPGQGLYLPPEKRVRMW